MNEYGAFALFALALACLTGSLLTGVAAYDFSQVFWRTSRSGEVVLRWGIAALLLVGAGASGWFLKQGPPPPPDLLLTVIAAVSGFGLPFLVKYVVFPSRR